MKRAFLIIAKLMPYTLRNGLSVDMNCQRTFDDDHQLIPKKLEPPKTVSNGGSLKAKTKAYHQ